MKREPLALIVAVGENGVIGRDGKVPWRVPEDLKFFKRTTMGHAVIMGRKTWDEVGRPLPGRRNIVVTRQAGWSAQGAEVARSLDDAIAMARATDPAPFVIGGAEIYRLALPHATVIYRTRVLQTVDGDTNFPAFDESEWEITESRAGDGAVFETLRRRA